MRLRRAGEEALYPAAVAAGEPGWAEAIAS